MSGPDRIVAFWRAAGPDKWFAKDDAFDAAFRQDFQADHLAAARRQHDDWSADATGALALCLLLDQWPRNCFRGTGHAFATDPVARLFARRAIAAGHDQTFEQALRPFFYLPFQHSEDIADQKQSLALFGALTTPDADKWARHHHDIIARFGRFPHRNAALGRVTTPEEAAFLEADGFRG
ncbi:MAG TPA: DUF924 family protein [Brevundimonas sp.]|uniref:DUF924 family protein n=1 Tax=Brevundimonas sp. TaxID=1871086 RepID=UPI002B63899E|nr:DUF924 family protein [Brevundimonas sp.]HRH20123.1 DUF924 family protein [Brevundimonas sp.]